MLSKIRFIWTKTSRNVSWVIKALTQHADVESLNFHGVQFSFMHIVVQYSIQATLNLRSVWNHTTAFDSSVPSTQVSHAFTHTFTCRDSTTTVDNEMHVLSWKHQLLLKIHPTNAFYHAAGIHAKPRWKRIAGQPSPSMNSVNWQPPSRALVRNRQLHPSNRAPLTRRVPYL